MFVKIRFVFSLLALLTIPAVLFLAAPDWLPIRTDIEGPGHNYNAAFSFTGQFVPEPSTWTLLAVVLLVLALWRKKLINR